MKNILFDLDGTLLPMDVEEFTQKYFGYIVQTMNNNGRDGKTILKAIGYGVDKIINNDGSVLNDILFWESFEKACGISRKEIEPEFTVFYENVFDKIDVGVQSPNMIQAVSILKEKGYKLYLTTNPLFPRIATEKRIKWAGLDINDFELVTTFENASYCKPNVNYYKEVIESQGLDIHECMMVGNDVKEDGVVETLGIPVYLVNDYLLNKYNLEINTKWLGTSEDFLAFVNELPSLR